MNILVCLKMVSKSTYADTFAESASAERLSGGQLELNPADAYALEMALKIKDADARTRITVLTMAPKSGDQILRTALAMGADSAYHISDRAYAGSDTIATAGIISGTIKTLEPFDLILCGRKAIDSETGHIGPQLAQSLGIPLLSGVLSFRAEDGCIYAVRAQSDGTAEYKCAFPVLLSVINGTGMVRTPTIFGLRRAKSTEIPIVDASSVPAVSSGTETVSVTELCFAHRKGERVTDIEQGIEGLVRLL